MATPIMVKIDPTFNVFRTSAFEKEILLNSVSLTLYRKNHFPIVPCNRELSKIEEYIIKITTYNPVNIVEFIFNEYSKMSVDVLFSSSF